MQQQGAPRQKNWEILNLMNQTLEKQVFANDIEFSAFQNLLSRLNHMEVVKISRDEYDNKKEWIIEPTWKKDTWWEYYVLYLPEDVVIGDLLRITDMINTKFWLDLYADTKHLIGATKATVWAILKNNGNDMSVVDEMVKKYHISPALKEKIMAQPIKPTRKLRDFIGSMQEEKIMGEEYTKLLQHEFDLTFFRKWINMLRLWMETITQAEYEEIAKKQKDWKNHISFYKDKENIDKKVSLLREKVKLDEYKETLWFLREKIKQEWNPIYLDELQNTEKKATHDIMQALLEYPYQLTNDNYGYQPNAILQHKEIYCVWYSLLAHALLSELWIQHQWLQFVGHSAIEVDIGNQKYYFDPTYGKYVNQEMLPFEWWESDWFYKEIVLQGGNFFNKKQYADNWDIEEILYMQILNNLWNSLTGSISPTEKMKSIYLFDKTFSLKKDPFVVNNKWSALLVLWKYKEALACFDYAIKIWWSHEFIYWNKWEALFKLRRYKEALEAYNEALKINPCRQTAYNRKSCIFADMIWEYSHQTNLYLAKLKDIYQTVSPYLQKKEEWKIIEIDNNSLENDMIITYITQKDYQWLREYLLEMEDWLDEMLLSL